MSDLKERKPDGGLADLIEFYEEMGGEDDGEMLVLLLELRAFRRTRDKERERIAELEAELAHRDAAAGEPVAFVGSDFSLFWAGSGPIAPLIQRQNIKVGAKLYTAQPSALPPNWYFQLTFEIPDLENMTPYQAHGAAWKQCIENAKALGCKAIKLPKVKWTPCDCIDCVRVYDVEDVIESLKAQGFTVEGE